MKKITLLFVFAVLCFVNDSFGQYYYIPHLSPLGSNPGGLNSDNEYPAGGGLPGGWTNVITGPNVSPVWSATQTIPFTFSFNGTSEGSYKVSSSGVLTFDVATGVSAPSAINASLPSAAIPDKSICLWGIDVTTASSLTHTSSVVSKTFGAAPNRQHWVMYAGCSIPGNSSSWVFWSIVLEETTNKIYIVDQRTSTATTTLTVGVQISSSAATSVAASPSVNSFATSDASPADNVYYEFVYGIQPAYDVTATGITMKDYLAFPLAPFDITGKIENWGSSALSSVVLNYQVDAGAPVTSSPVTGTIPVFGSASFVHPITWTPPAPGTYSIKVWASSLDGNPDQNTANDAYTKSITVVATSVQREPVFEVFTSSTCGPCAAASPNLEGVFAANPDKFTCIKYQMNWPGSGDIYYNADGETRRAYYGISSIPDMFVDGVRQSEGSYTTAMLNTERSQPSFIDIDAHYTIANKKVTVSGTVNGLADFPANKNLKMHIGVVEFTTTANVSTNGETEFHFVEQKMMPSGAGTSLTTLTSGTPYTINKTYTFPATSHVEEFTDLGVLVFVQNNVTKEVYQSGMATIPPTGIGEGRISGEGIVKIFPNPLRTNAVLLYQQKQNSSASVAIFNILGEKVCEQSKPTSANGLQQMDLHLGNLSAGIYFVQLNIGGIVYSQKIIKSE